MILQKTVRSNLIPQFMGARHSRTRSDLGATVVPTLSSISGTQMQNGRADVLSCFPYEALVVPAVCCPPCLWLSPVHRGHRRTEASGIDENVLIC